MVREHIEGHTMDASAVALDPTPLERRRRTGTKVRCTCGRWTGSGSAEAPSAGGLVAVTTQHRAHLADVISRDPQRTAALASQEWRTWQPGDGSAYRVRLVTLVGGPDHGDKVLLVSIGRHCWSVQFATVPYRQRENGPIRPGDAITLGLPLAIWHAVRPLLVHLGASDAD